MRQPSPGNRAARATDRLRPRSGGAGLGPQRFHALGEELGEGMPQWVLHGEDFPPWAECLRREASMGCWPTLGSARCSWTRRTEDLVFRRTATRYADGSAEGATAEQVVNQAEEKVLADLIYEFGEERRSRRIARAIVRSRPMKTTAQLAKVVSAAAPAMKSERGRN